MRGTPEVCVAQPDRNFESELFSEVLGGSGRYVEDTGEWEGVAAVGVLSTIHLQAGVVHTKPDIPRIFIRPVNKENSLWVDDSYQ